MGPANLRSCRDGGGSTKQRYQSETNGLAKKAAESKAHANSHRQEIESNCDALRLLVCRRKCQTAMRARRRTDSMSVVAHKFHRPFFRDAEPFDPHIVHSLSDGFLLFWCQVAHEK